MKKKCRHVKAIIQFRRATEREWVEVNPILRAGEPALSTDVMKIKVGDGIHNWLSLDYIDRSGGDSVDFIYTTEGLTGQENRLYINKTDGTALIWNGEGFEELESSSIDDLKIRMGKAEDDIIVLTEKIDKGADKNYIHNQQSASDLWTIVHNLGKFPSITVVDSAGTTVVGEIVLQTESQAIIKFNAPFSGKAYCN